ncbi:hypothetical protein C1645_832144 [Glomus cerebriforme]|uniref:SAM domain-containing protein n=1 Tax=Glomus cerebriforme TaxID=658196 RepID=A0A397SK80_9GLOM|nr:hypothetical protein C1645_832144 [Glomus cerebriforme]
MSETNTPASTTTSATGNEAVTLADEIKKYDTTKLIDFLRGERDLGLDNDDLEIIRKEKVNGRAFINITKEELRDYGMKGGPAKNLADFAKDCKEKKLKAFSSYKSLRKVLQEYGLESEGTDTIPLFSLQTHEIQDSDKHFEHCVENILFRMKHYGSLLIDSLESMRNEYVSTILHTSLHIAGDLTKKDFSMRPEFEIIGEESSGRVDYAIKEAENLICVTEDKVQRTVLEGFAQNIKQLESSYQTNKKKRKRDDDDDFDYLYGIVTSARDWHFLLYSPGEISQASELPVTIEFNKKALDKNSNAYQSLRNGVKEVLGIIVGLLKDRVSAEDEPPSKKRARIEGYRSKK